MKKSIAIDMDQTVADTLARHLQWYCQEFDCVLTKEDTLGKKIYDVVPAEHLASVRAYPHHPDFFKDLSVFDNAINVIKRLAEDYTVYFASAAMEYPASFDAKYQWLREHFPFISDRQYIFCGYKGMLNCDYLIDDSACHMDSFQGTGLLFTSEHNIHEQDYLRVDNWIEVEKYFYQ